MTLTGSCGWQSYTDQLGRCVPGLISIDTWFQPMPQWTRGKAVFYGPSVMEATARWRGIDLSHYVDGIALPSCYHIGQTAWIHRGDGVWEGPYVVADCAGRGDMYSAVVYTGEVVEVGWKTATRWQMARFTGGGYAPYPGHRDVDWFLDVEVWIGDQPRRGQMRGLSPVDYPSWYLSQVTFARRHEPHPVYLEPGRWLMRHANANEVLDVLGGLDPIPHPRDKLAYCAAHLTADHCAFIIQ